MKKVKYLILLLLLFFTTSVNVSALTVEQRADVMKQNLENYRFNFKYVDMTDNYELIKEHNLEASHKSLSHVFLTGLVRSELENVIDFGVNDAIDIACYLEGDEYVSGYDSEFNPITSKRANDGCGALIYLNDIEKEEQTSFYVELLGDFVIVDGDPKIKKEAFSIVEKIVDNVYVADVDMLNHYLNYKSNSSTFFDGNNALLEFASLKKIVEDYPEYDFFVGYEDTRRGAAYVSFAEGSTYVERDGIVYGFTYNTYTSANMFFVPVGTEISKYGKTLEKRLKDYINDKNVNIKILPYDENRENFLNSPNADVGYTLKNNLNIDIDQYYKNVGTNYQKEAAKLTKYGCDDESCVAMHSYQLVLNGEIYEIGIAELDKDTLNKFGTILSKDSKTGIILKTSSGNVPLDAKLVVETFKLNSEERKLLKSLGYNGVGAYNLELYSAILDKVIDKFNDVTHVLIPYNNKWSKNMKIIYISDDLKTVEYYEPEIVTYEGKKYLQFGTKHFSNYVLAEYNIENPNTSDNINLYISLSFISFGAMMFMVLSNTRKLKSKKNKCFM